MGNHGFLAENKQNSEQNNFDLDGDVTEDDSEYWESDSDSRGDSG